MVTKWRDTAQSATNYIISIAERELRLNLRELRNSFYFIILVPTYHQRLIIFNIRCSIIHLDKIHIRLKYYKKCNS